MNMTLGKTITITYLKLNLTTPINKYNIQCKIKLNKKQNKTKHLN